MNVATAAGEYILYIKSSYYYVLCLIVKLQGTSGHTDGWFKKPADNTKRFFDIFLSTVHVMPSSDVQPWIDRARSDTMWVVSFFDYDVLWKI